MVIEVRIEITSMGMEWLWRDQEEAWENPESNGDTQYLDLDGGYTNVYISENR